MTETAKQTNRQFAGNEDFKLFCGIADIKPTKRQASKYRMKKGAAFNRGKDKRGAV